MGAAGLRGAGGHAEGPRPSAPAPRPAAPPPAFHGAPPAASHYDGRGQVLDGRYNHGRYYAPVGTVAHTLPGEYRAYYHRGAPYYFSGGVWYAPRGPGFVVVTPPIGLSIAVLPPYYSTLWVAGVPYYYADSVYYTAAPDQSGYVVATPPPDDGGRARRRPTAAPIPAPRRRLVRALRRRRSAVGPHHLPETGPVEGSAGCRRIRVPQLGEGSDRLRSHPAGRRCRRRGCGPRA